jgi:hypothetical protein
MTGPVTLVRDLLNDLCGFRNVLAHGQEIPIHPFRQKYDLISTGGDRINYEDYYWATLMYEAGLFMLSTALRKMFAAGLVDDVKDLSKWTSSLTLYEHQYKASGSARPNKTRGR